MPEIPDELLFDSAVEARKVATLLSTAFDRPVSVDPDNPARIDVKAQQPFLANGGQLLPIEAVMEAAESALARAGYVTTADQDNPRQIHVRKGERPVTLRVPAGDPGKTS